MPLSALSFADLLLLPDGSGVLKGTSGFGSDELQLVSVPEDCQSEIDELRQALVEAFMSRKILRENGTQELPSTIRLAHGGVHYRVADMHDVKGQTWFLRRLTETVPDLHELGLHRYLLDWILAPEQHQGLLLISGAQASGKTTTASALVAARLAMFGGHAVTFENPAELPLGGRHGEHGYCFQSEILSEQELAVQIERAHRYASPNIIYIGEIRTRFAALEVLRVALGSSQQMVVATIHGLDIITALERLLNWARELDGANAAQNLANSLLAVIHQELHINNEKRVLRIPQFLLVPFAEGSKGLRSKIRDGLLQNLGDDMREQKNRILYNRGLDK